MDLLLDAREEALAARTRALIASATGVNLWEQWSANRWFDGSGESTLADHALRFRELGRALVPGPFLATVIAARMAEAADDTETRDDIQAGRAVVAMATPLHALISVTRAGESDPGDARISGRFRVFDRAGCTHVLLAAANGSFLLADGGLPPGDELQSIDPQVGVETVSLHEAHSVLWTSSGKPLDEAAVLVAAMAAGIAEATLGASTEFAKVREQFGKPIGAFQAVKHRCADMAIRAEAAWCQTAYAALCTDVRRADAEFQSRTAKVVAADAAIQNAGANIQNHGAVGCTVENDAHLYVKRAWVLEQLGGTSPEHLAALLRAPAPE